MLFSGIKEVTFLSRFLPTLITNVHSKGWVASLEKDLLWLKARGSVVEDGFVLSDVYDPNSSWRPIQFAKRVRKFSKSPFANLNILPMFAPLFSAFSIAVSKISEIIETFSSISLVPLRSASFFSTIFFCSLSDL